MSLMFTEPVKRRRLLYGASAFALVAMIGLGVMAKSGWLWPKDYGDKDKSGILSYIPYPSSFSSPTPTPQLSKEYVYSGSRLLSVVDANASEVPPADLGVWRPSTGVWYILGATQTTYTWGVSGDKPAQGDFDGDGKTDFSVYRPSDGKWYIVRSSDGSDYWVYFGNSTDIPVPADYDGDGKTDTALWRPSDRIWYIIPSSTGVPYYPQFGSSGDKPAPADYDGDGKADLGVWRNSEQTFYSKNSSDGQLPEVTFGNNGDIPVSADYDGDGKANYALMSGADWIIMNADLAATTTTTFQPNVGIPVPNDYDGDGKVDIAIWCIVAVRYPAIWYIRQSRDLSTRVESWGKIGDIPVPALYRR